jgi:hypothetical protein
LTYSTFCCVAKWIKYVFFLTHPQTIPHNDEVKTCFKNVCKFIENEIQKYLISKSIHTSESILCRCTFGRVFLRKFLRVFHTWSAQHLPIIIFKTLQALSNWLLNIARHPFLGLDKDFQVDLSKNCNSATQEHSLSSWLPTPVYIWPCVLGYCPVKRGINLPVSVGKQTEPAFPL